MKNRTLSALAAASLLATAMPAAASELFGVHYPSATPLYGVNQSNGALTTIGDTGFDNVGDLTSDVANGVIYGVKIDTNQLFTINPATGAGSILSSITGAEHITSLAFNPLSGKLYGNETVSFSGVATDMLYDINPATGVATFVGRIGFSDVFALAFANDGTLYGVSNAAASNELITISLLNGNGTLVAGTGLATLFDIAARPEDGVMFAANGSGGLYTLDLATAAPTFVGNFTDTPNIVGLAFIPAPSSAAALALLGLATLRRRRGA